MSKYTPNTQDLELAAEALLRLRRRRLRVFSTDRFRELTRARATFSADDMLGFCERCDLVAHDQDGWHLTKSGAEIVARFEGADWARYGTIVLRSGLYDSELTRLIEVSTVEAGHLRCPLATVRRIAPSAGAVLAWDTGRRRGADLVLGLAELDELLALSAMERAATTPAWVEERQTVGWRAELYSLRYERARAGPQRVLHISQDVGDGFGYDIEVTDVRPSRFVEVKGSRSRRIRFVLTATELAAADRYPDRYELHFWGEISLAREPAAEFAALVGHGYPLVIPDFAQQLKGGGWSKEAASWRVVGPERLQPGHRSPAPEAC